MSVVRLAQRGGHCDLSQHGCARTHTHTHTRTHTHTHTHTYTHTHTHTNHTHSGTGKSTLLSVLGGRSTCRISGDMLFNGKKMTKPIKRKLGFVTQDDLLFAEVRLPLLWCTRTHYSYK